MFGAQHGMYSLKKQPSRDEFSRSSALDWGGGWVRLRPAPDTPPCKGFEHRRSEQKHSTPRSGDTCQVQVYSDVQLALFLEKNI